MVTYVALLRGINVGGNSKVSMESLVIIFESLGFTKVKTYINSGNIIFTTTIDRTRVAKLIEDALYKKFKFPIKVILRSKQEILQTINNFPSIFSEINWRHNIIFLGDSIDSPKILRKFNLRPEIELNSYNNGVIFWSADLSSGTRAIMYKLSKDPSYQEMTVRSIGTVKKIYELMNS